MPKFRKKPVVIEAVQWTGRASYDAVSAFVTRDDDVCFVNPLDPGGYVEIPTPEGTMKATAGDWIIRGVAGEIYPCKPDIFAATYEAVE